MELKSLFCPNCGASLEVEDGLDTFFCKYCGYKILLQGQSKAAYDAKVRVKHMEHKERLQDKRDAQERYRMEFKQKDERRTLAIVFGILGAIIAMCLIISAVGNAGAKKQDRELQAIVDQIMIDIENEDFAAAYVKANSLYWDDSWTSEGEDKWDATRKEIIKQIEEAEKKATGSITNSSNEDEDDGGSFWDWFG
ncbi:MAG: hypothetical protein MR828_01075 [Clostridiales bacterium]|jgi:DNA-directed RNA polymerase subunit RPC12/RpoP|nr:hypothetical protein [Clostridiales bacterium]